MKKIFIYAVSILISGCAVNPSDLTGSGGRGAVSGLILGQVIGTATKALTAKYPLIYKPFEFCRDEGEDLVVCYLTPCKVDCTNTYTDAEFLDYSPIVISLPTGSNAITSFETYCNKKPEDCLLFIGTYAGGKILIKEKE